MVTTGVIVYNTKGHHYVEPHKPISNAVVKQVLGKNMTGLFGLDTDVITDVMCHKMAHPVTNAVLTSLAVDDTIKARMSALNLASAVVRVPARSDAERRADANLVVVVKMTPMLDAMRVNIGTLEADMRAIIGVHRNAIRAAATPAARLAAEEALRQDMTAFEPTVAYLYGAYTVMVADDPNESLVRSKGLANLSAEHRAMIAKGANQYRIAQTWTADRIRAGALPGVGLHGAVAPAPLRPDPSESPMAQLAPILGAIMGRPAAPVAP